MEFPLEYMSGEMVRWSFGFANPNHAAAAICALLPFCWGWGGVRGAPCRCARRVMYHILQNAIPSFAVTRDA